jgi:hypothetical protein
MTVEMSLTGWKQFTEDCGIFAFVVADDISGSCPKSSALDCKKALFDIKPSLTFTSFTRPHHDVSSSPNDMMDGMPCETLKKNG